MTPLLIRAPARTYSIAQLCRELGATARALRYYEEIGLVSPLRNGTQRIYGIRDRARLILILRGRRVGLSLPEIREILLAHDEGGEASQAARAYRAFQGRLQALVMERGQIEDAIRKLRKACERLSERAPGSA